MNISRLFIFRPVATLLLTLALLLLGVLGYRLLPVAPLPQVDFPTIMVSAKLAGASPKPWRQRLPRRWNVRWGKLRASRK